MFSQGQLLCFSKWRTNGARWQIEKDWKGITTFVVPCQPQGHIPEMRISHRGTSILFQHQHILVLSVSTIIWRGQLKLLSGFLVLQRFIKSSKNHFSSFFCLYITKKTQVKWSEKWYNKAFPVMQRKMRLWAKTKPRWHATLWHFSLYPRDIRAIFSLSNVFA